jgi:hypothetical protein
MLAPKEIFTDINKYLDILMFIAQLAIRASKNVKFHI